ncbi:MAG TPA: Slp family lipoprotein, partial [Candidatus Eisenbacteria bacterium]|nr:Slp family lipoprotein [Candidatus Eisenbacteria bacterium]
MRWLWPVLLAGLVGGCATAFPESVMRTVNTRITADELLRDPAALKGARVILGGEILATAPKAGETEIEVLSRRLDSGDAPERSDSSAGRFLIRTPEFLDPAIYSRGRRVTVLGTLAGSEKRPVAELPYAY